MIRFQTDLSCVDAKALSGGFFIGWPNPPTPEAHLEILRGSYAIVLALDEYSQVVGFVNAISDGVCSAYLPLLEVLPEHQGKGVGAELVRRMLMQLRHIYMIDLSCDESLIPYYRKLGFVSGTAMMIRNYDHQDCG